MFRKATLGCLRSPKPDCSGLTWLSEHSPSPGGHGFERRTNPSAVLDLGAPPHVEDRLTLADMKSLHQWLRIRGERTVPVELRLDGNPMEQAHIEELAKMLETAHVSALDLGFCHIGRQQLQALCTAIACHGSVASLQLRDNNCSESASTIALMIEQCTTLTALDLERCQLDELGIEIIGTASSSNRTLQKLGLGVNKWGNKGWSAMTNVLKNSSLLDLRMDSVKLPPDNAVFADFCKALEINTTLERLAFGHDAALSSDQTDCLNQALERNTGLAHLEMWYQPFSSVSVSGTESVHKGWSNNCGLKSVSFVPIHFGKDGCNALISLLKNDKSHLVSLELWANHIDEGGLRELQAAIINNRNLKNLEINWKDLPVSIDGIGAIDQALVRNRGLHVAAGHAVRHLSSRAGLTLPHDMAIELGQAFRNCTTGSTMTAVVEALFVKV